MTARPCLILVTVLACGGSGASPPAATTNTAAPAAGAKHRARLTVAKCTPVGFGYSCTAEIDGTPATLEACVGSGDHVGLTPKITPPITLNVEVESAPDTERYCGVLIMPAGEHVKVVAVE